MNVLITYDIAEGPLQESKHTEVKDDMKAKGYRDHFKIKDKDTIYYLPNTTLWKEDTSSSIAKTDLLAVAKLKNAKVERLIATKFESLDAIPGEQYKKK